MFQIWAQSSRSAWIAVNTVSLFSTSAPQLLLALGQRAEDDAGVLDQGAEGLLVRVEDLEQIAAALDELGQVADRVVELVAPAVDRAGDALLPRPVGLARVRVERVEDLVELDEVADLARRPAAPPSATRHPLCDPSVIST